MKNKMLILFFVFLATETICQVKLPRFIADNMILQRNTVLNIWGWASPGEEVGLHFMDKKHTTKADEEGNWTIPIPAHEAGGPHQMTFKASNEITLENICFGDVWVCSGQSNMELTMERVKEKYSDVIKQSENPEIRQFLVPDEYNFKKAQADVSHGSWVSATPKTVLDFSAVAYFFAKELYEQYQVPIGLINAAVGGSPVEAWMSEDALKKFPSAYNELQKFKDDSLIAQIQNDDRERVSNWYDHLNQKDQGLTANPTWSEPGVKDENWNTMHIPGYWDNTEIGNVNGVVWFRKEIDIPGSMAGKPAKLWLGRIVDQDFVYVNGKLVGTTGYQYPPRRYNVDAEILLKGRNTIAIRVINNSGRGGFIKDKPYYLAVGNDTIDLKGTWKYKIGATMKPLRGQTFIRWKPGGLYNQMIAPLTKYSIKGVIWYQGESNADDPDTYKSAFPDMIRYWRGHWGQGNFPFLYVQLANYMEPSDIPAESNWAELRQAQLEALSVPNTGMAVTIDLGEWNDIHPLNKKDVGKRLSLLARKLAYKEINLTASSPLPEKAEFRKDYVLVTFKNVGEGLTTSDGRDPAHFSISENGNSFVWAKTEIINKNTVKIWHTKIDTPAVIRYAWADNPVSANLCSSEGLPASPFEVKGK